MDKLILDMTDAEILKEISEILGHKAVKPKEKIGWITDNPTDYFRDKKVHTKDLYDLYKTGAYVEDYIKTLSITSLRNRPKELFALIRKQKPGNKVLEYGCGTSTHGIACAQLGCEVHIVDISPRMLEVAKQRYSNRGLEVNIHTIENDFPTFPKKYFDTIICTDVLEHVPEPISLIKYFISWLKIGGMIHLHASTFVNLQKGHLPKSIQLWKTTGRRIMKNRFKKIVEHNYKLIK